jgi:hypothetical protein
MEVKGYPNYLIYNDGRVYSKYSNKFIIGGWCGLYKNATLRNNPKKKTFTIHRLVAEHYIPNPNNYNVVDHIDRNRLNNNVSNLRWCRSVDNSHNTGKYITNKSGHKNIHYRKDKKSWIYCCRYLGKPVFRRSFKNKIDTICYKFICLLRINKMK